MAKQTGLGDQLFVDGYDIAGDIQQIGGLSTPIAALEMTGINKEANEREYGLADGQAEFTSFFNDAAGAAHVALKSLPRTDGHVMYLRGAGIGNAAISVIGKRIDYAATRGDDGSLTFGVTAQGSGTVVEWAQQVTAGRVSNASGASSASLDLGTGTKSFGFQAYLQAFSLGSGSAAVKLQTSSDNGAGDAWADLTNGAFANVTGRGTQRIVSASPTLAVERYVRVVTSGTFSNLSFCVTINRNNGPRFL